MSTHRRMDQPAVVRSLSKTVLGNKHKSLIFINNMYIKMSYFY